MTDKEKTRTSKFLSLVLRHKPETIGITLDENGWVLTRELIYAAKSHGTNLDFDTLREIITTNDKKRFEYDSPEERLVRASQGHSVEIDLGYQVIEPPEFLYHGTFPGAIGGILKYGIQKGQRHDVHLSENFETAIKVGSRRGDPVIFVVKAIEMFQDGFKFTKSTNNVWLTNEVPPKYLSRHHES